MLFICSSPKLTSSKFRIIEAKIIEKPFIRNSDVYIDDSVAQTGFLDQWANFSCVEKKRWAKWARFLLIGHKIFGPTKH
jgi:hypothetical protein